MRSSFSRRSRITAGRSCSVSSGTTGKGYLQREFLFLGGGKRVHVGSACGTMVAQGLLDQRVDVGIGMHRVMMEESELLDPRLLRERQRLFEGRMAKAGLCRVLLGGGLRVVNQQDRIAAPVGDVLQLTVLVIGDKGHLPGGRIRTQ